MSNLIGTIYNKISNMKMKWKVILTYILLSILPIAALNTFAYQYTRNILLDHEKSLAADALNQAALQVDYQQQVYNSLSNYLFNDSKILSAINDEYLEQYYKMYKIYNEDVIPPFQMYFSLHTDLTGLTIFTESDLHPYGTYVRPIAELEALVWYPNVENQYLPVWLVTEKEDQKSLCSVRQMVFSSERHYRNYLYIELDYDAFFSPLQAISTSGYGVTLVDEGGNSLFSYNNQIAPLSPGSFRNGDISSLEEEYMLLDTRINGGLWTIYYYRPLSMVTDSVANLIQMVFVILWIGLIIIGILAWLFSHIIVSPIEALTENMQRVQQGDLRVTVKSQRSDEVGILIRSFSDMIKQLDHLIQVVYKNEIEKKEYQLTILRAQINPHFLYNSLSLINSKAIISGQDQISQMALFLTSFYRTALNHGQDKTTVENELSNIRSYVSIQQLLYDNAFAVEYELDEAAMECTMPNFILQPIVENAINHGLRNDIKPGKRLKIKTALEENMLYLTVEDNGTGMSREQVDRLFQSQTSGYGLKNVNERLHLLYGPDYDFSITSIVGNGTIASVSLPIPDAQSETFLLQ